LAKIKERKEDLQAAYSDDCVRLTPGANARVNWYPVSALIVSRGFAGCFLSHGGFIASQCLENFK
jgi:hypothetical protein